MKFKKYIKKINSIILILVILIVTFSVPSSSDKVEAKTLRGLKQELAALQEKYNNSQNEKKLTEQEIQNKKNRITEINIEIYEIEEEMKTLTEEIEQLGIEIEEKEQEIKDIMNYYQVASGESAYLEYVFDAVDFTDFIYRMAISEQLSIYNKQLVDEYNEKIKQNEQKKKDLDAKTVSLREKQVTLQKEVESLGTQLDEIFEESLSIEEEIKILKESVNLYENVYKCDLDEDLNSCTASTLPSGTEFFRPLTSGMISSNYGPRTFWWGNSLYSDFHEGVDFAGVAHGTNVYPIAAGKVVAIVDAPSLLTPTKRTVCGGTKVFIAHVVNGQKYTSGYYHLASYNVYLGQAVTPSTVIGTVGGVPSIEWWDNCSTGAHLHLQLATEHYTIDYKYYSEFVSRRFDPRNILILPAEDGWFSGR